MSNNDPVGINTYLKGILSWFEFEQVEIGFKGRRLTGFWKRLTSVTLSIMAILLLYFNSYAVISGIRVRSFFLAFIIFHVFLLIPATEQSPKDKPSPLDIILSSVGTAVFIYPFFNYAQWSAMGGHATTFHYILAALAILILFEATRRTLGWSLCILAAFFLAYAYFGPYLPGILAFKGFRVTRILYMMYLVPTGIFGIVLGIAATFVYTFILFGSFLQVSGGDKFFTDLSLVIAGSSAGGPAKVAVIGSGLMGTISGSAVANVVTTGSITIPLMKSVGYSPSFAAAVEAVASTGGSYMPPIMASAGFLIAEFLGIPYLYVMSAAITPALIYYLSIFIVVHLEAKKLGLHGLPSSQLPSVKQVMISKGHLIIPILVIIYFLVTGWTPLFAGVWGLVSIIIVSQFRKETRLKIRDIFIALQKGSIATISVGIPCAIVGTVVGIATMSGLGSAIAYAISALSEGKEFLTVILLGLVTIFLGMGLPTAAAYIVAYIVIVPVLIEFGFIPIAAHFFVLYYAVVSGLTPPVALTIFAAAGLSGAPFSKIAIQAMKMALPAYVLPLIFLYSPAILLQDTTLPLLVRTVVTSVAGIACLSVAFQNIFLIRLNLLERVIFLFAGVLLLLIKLNFNIIGSLLLFGVILIHRIRYKHAGIGSRA